MDSGVDSRNYGGYEWRCSGRVEREVGRSADSLYENFAQNGHETKSSYPITSTVSIGLIISRQYNDDRMIFCYSRNHNRQTEDGSISTIQSSVKADIHRSQH